MSRSSRYGARKRSVAVAVLAVFAALLCGAATASAAPSNDSFTTPDESPLNVLREQDNSTATTQAGELLFCGGTQEVNYTVWYRFTGTGGAMTVSTEGSAIDTILAVYTDTDPTNPSNNIGCNDDASGSVSFSKLTFNSTAGTKYLIQVGGCVTAGCGTAQGLIQHIVLGNDNRGFAENITGGSSITRANTGSATEAGETLACAGSSYGATVWFHYVAPAAGTAVFSTSRFNNTLAVFQGASGTPLSCSVGNSGTSPTAPRVSLDVTPGDYYIQVGTVAGQGTNVFNLQTEFTENKDVDKDGETKDTDCDDANPARHHGATDVAGNGVDEDCSGADAVPPPPDGDKDGVPDASDKCKSENASKRDTNKDGCLDPTAFTADAVLTAVPTGRGVKIIRLRVIAPKGARVIVKCSRGCARTSKKARTISIPKLKNKTLRSGTTVKIWITLSRRIGKYIEYRVTRGNFKKTRTRCLLPGSFKPRTKCS